MGSPAIARRARSVRRAPIFIAGRSASSRAAAGRRACASLSAHPVSSRRSSACASISPCGAAPSSDPSCASRASLPPTPPSGIIIAQLVARGAVHPVLTLRRRPYARRWTAKRRFAQRLPRGLTANEPGSLVQLDTVHVNVAPDKSIKHFTAYDPIAKWTVAKAFNRATAASAAIFLDKIVTEMPFPVKAIQVDGGSEFMAEFEDACEKKGLRLFVLPPKSPQMNGAVERCNGAWRYEFYAVYDLPRSVEAINPI
jgi:transposase InsO family protein